MPNAISTVANIETYDYLSIDSFARRYLNTYYLQIDPDELEIAKFLVEEYKKINGKPHMLEIGCGPTIHHVIPAVPYVSSIDMADYLSENLYQVKLWKDGIMSAHNWNHFTKKILELEGMSPSTQDIQTREALLKELMNGFYYCNVLKEKPLDQHKKYPIINFFYTAEEVALNLSEWKKIMKRVSDILLPGGQLLLSALWETDHYIIQKNGGYEKLPTARLNKIDMQTALFDLGFDMQKTIVKIAKTPSQAHQGINGVILVSAKKL